MGNREIFVKRQMDHDSPEYYLWESLGGDSASTPTTLLHPDGSIHVLYRGSDKPIYHKAKLAVTKGTLEWSDWNLLGNDNGLEASFQTYSCWVGFDFVTMNNNVMTYIISG